MDRSTPTIMNKRHNRLSPSLQARWYFTDSLGTFFSDFYANNHPKKLIVYFIASHMTHWETQLALSMTRDPTIFSLSLSLSHLWTLTHNISYNTNIHT